MFYFWTYCKQTTDFSPTKLSCFRTFWIRAPSTISHIGFSSSLSTDVFLFLFIFFTTGNDAIIIVTTSCFLLIYMPVCLTVMLGSFYLIIPFYFYWHSVTSLNFKAKQIILLVTNFPWRHVRNTWRDPFQIRVKWWFATFPTGTMLASGTCFMASGSGLLCYFFYFFFLSKRMAYLHWCSELKKKNKNDFSW